MAVIAVCLLGALFRCQFLSAMAIEHFDEGVYASNLWFSPEQGAEYPGRYFYAPPLFPFLIEWSMIFLGSGPWGHISAFAGLGDIDRAFDLVGGAELVWSRGWIGGCDPGQLQRSPSDLQQGRIDRCRFGLLSAAGSLSHLEELSRSWLEVARAGRGDCRSRVGCQIQWLASVGCRSFRAGAVAPGSASATESQDWLHPALGSDRRVGFLVWSPVLIGLQKWGGYSVVASNHSRYVVGFSGWLDSFLRQVENHELMQGTLSDTGLGLVCLVFCLLFIQWNWRRSRQRAADQSKSQTDRSTWNAILSGVLAAVPLLGAWVLGVSPVLGILSSAGILLQLFLTGNGSGQEQGGSENPHGEVGSKSLGRSLAAWLLAAWFLWITSGDSALLSLSAVDDPLDDLSLVGDSGVRRLGGAALCRFAVPQ